MLNEIDAIYGGVKKYNAKAKLSKVMPIKDEPQYLKIMSFNILAENCVDFVNPSEYYPYINPEELKMKNRLPGIVEQIKKHMADVVMLQEATEDVRLKLISMLPEYIFMDLAINNKHEPKHLHWCNLTMLKRGIFHSIKHSVKHLNKTSYTAYSITSCKLGEVPVVVVNVHYDAEDYKMRRVEHDALLKFLHSMMKTHVIIIGGDFNTDDPTLHGKMDGKFQPAIQKKDASGTYLCEKAMIDHIYVRGLDVLRGHISNGALCGSGVCSLRNKEGTLDGKKQDGKKCNKQAVEKTPKCMRKTISSVSSDHYPIIAETIVTFKV
jgi:endonuclease/exonuclease/phosphatase family metal-dependent hydrolase